MSNTVTEAPGFTHIKFSSNALFQAIPSTSQGCWQITSICFKGITAGNTCIIRDSSTAGAIIFDRTDAFAGGLQEVYDYLRCRPVIASTEITSGDMVLFEYT